MSKLAAAEVCLERVEPGLSVKGFWASFSKSFAKLHCRLVHNNISRPVNGKYRCWTCLQEFTIDF